MEADFQQYYGIDLGAFLFGRSGVPVRRLAGLIFNLPEDSRTTAIASEIPAGRWSRDEQLLALLLESQDLGHRLLVKLLASKAPPMGDPVRIEWPGRTAAEVPKPSSKAEIAQFLGAGRVRVVKGDTDGS